MAIFAICCLKCAEIPICIVVFEPQPRFATNGPQKNSNFLYFAKHRLIVKSNVLLQPPSWPKIVFYLFWNQKNIDLEQKHNFKSGKTKIIKRIWKRKHDRKPKKKRKGTITKKKCVIEYFDAVLFIKQKQRRQKNKERDKRKEPKESKK